MNNEFNLVKQSRIVEKLESYHETIAGYLESSTNRGRTRNTIYGLDRFGNAISHRIASDMMLIGVQVDDHYTLIDKLTEDEVKMRGLDVNAIRDRNVLFVVYQWTERHHPYAFAVKINKDYSELGRRPNDSRVLVGDDLNGDGFKLWTHEEIFRGRFDRAVNAHRNGNKEEYGMHLEDVGDDIASELHRVGGRAINSMGESSAIIQIGNAVYPAIGLGIMCLDYGILPDYLTVHDLGRDDIRDVLGGKNVIIVDVNDHVDIEPSFSLDEEGKGFFKELGVKTVNIFSSYMVD